jgi:hypothetical protein
LVPAGFVRTHLSGDLPKIFVNRPTRSTVMSQEKFTNSVCSKGKITMRRNLRPVLQAIGLLMLLLPGCSPAKAQSVAASAKTSPSNSVISEQDVSETREHLLALLRITPTLTEVVAADPSLLANQEYVNHSNPELGKFLQDHPEVARNPDFYLFADLPGGAGRRSERLVRRTWKGEFHDQQDPLSLQFLRSIGPFFIFPMFLGTLIWLIRILLENRRWGRIFKMQTEVHGRLIDKFGSNEELLSYMNTDAGKRFLEAAPIPINFESDQRIPATLSRVLFPLQGGVVLTLLGIGLLSLRSSLPEVSSPLLVFGIVILMPGIGLILSAGITWLLAARLGLMPHGTQGLRDSGDRS